MVGSSNPGRSGGILFHWYSGSKTHVHCCDRSAKETVNKENVDDLMPFSDRKPLTAKYMHQVRQKEWDESVKVSNKLHEIFTKAFGQNIILS